MNTGWRRLGLGLGLVGVLVLGALGLLGAVTISPSSLGPPRALAISLGMVPGYTPIHKFGRAPDVDTGAGFADVWSRSATQKTWLAPTAARAHTIVSTSTDDDDGGIGAHTVRISCLPTWATPEVTEEITMDGTTGVLTTGACATSVIIHRMQVTESGTSGPNVGVITATAAAPDSTVTAEIPIGTPDPGQTQMTIYGVPSGSTLCLAAVLLSINAGNPNGEVNFFLQYNHDPETEFSTFITKTPLGMANGTQPLLRPYPLYRCFDGPGIAKVLASATADNMDVTAEFDAVIFRP